MRLALCGVIVVCGCAAAPAADSGSGLQVDQSVGAFQVVKAGGALDDGVEVGKKLCYR